MAIQTRAYLKTKFENGDKPPETDFHDWLDSYWHKSEVPNGVSVVGAPGGGSYALPAGTLLESIVVYGPTPGVITIEKSLAGGDLFTAEPYTTTGNPVFVCNEFFATAETLLFSGYSGTITIKLYFR